MVWYMPKQSEREGHSIKLCVLPNYLELPRGSKGRFYGQELQCSIMSPAMSPIPHVSCYLTIMRLEGMDLLVLPTEFTLKP